MEPSIQNEGRRQDNADPDTEPRSEHNEHAARGHEADSRADCNAHRSEATGALAAKHRDDFIITAHIYRSGRDYAAILWRAQPAHAEASPVMTAHKSFTFDKYTLRPTTDEDMKTAVEWTAADPHHAGRTRPEFWLEQRVARDSYMLEDAEGPLFFFKLHRITINAVELHIQFPPPSDLHQKHRVQVGLIDGFNWLEKTLKLAHISVIHFDSAHGPLRQFAVGRLGFAFDTTQEHRLSKSIGG